MSLRMVNKGSWSPALPLPLGALALPLGARPRILFGEGLLSDVMMLDKEEGRFTWDAPASCDGMVMIRAACNGHYDMPGAQQPTGW